MEVVGHAAAADWEHTVGPALAVDDGMVEAEAHKAVADRETVGHQCSAFHSHQHLLLCSSHTSYSHEAVADAVAASLVMKQRPSNL